MCGLTIICGKNIIILMYITHDNRFWDRKYQIYYLSFHANSPKNKKKIVKKQFYLDNSINNDIRKNIN